MSKVTCPNCDFEFEIEVEVRVAMLEPKPRRRWLRAALGGCAWWVFVK